MCYPLYMRIMRIGRVAFAYFSDSPEEVLFNDVRTIIEHGAYDDGRHR